MSPQSPERAVLLREVLSRHQTASRRGFKNRRAKSCSCSCTLRLAPTPSCCSSCSRLDPQNALVPKVLRGLLDARINGRWDTTQANSYAVWALARYFKGV